MTYSISIAEAAENDLHEAFLWYEDQKESLGNVFEYHVNRALQSIQNNPLQTQIRYNNIHVFFLNKFPYGIQYQLNENEILIVAVFHTSQNPAKWTNR